MPIRLLGSTAHLMRKTMELREVHTGGKWVMLVEPKLVRFQRKQTMIICNSKNQATVHKL